MRCFRVAPSVLANGLRIAHAFSLRQPVAADHYIETVLRKSKLVVARLLGGQAYFAHFIQGVLDLKEEPVRPKFLIFSGTGSDDDELALLSDFPTGRLQPNVRVLPTWRQWKTFGVQRRESSSCWQDREELLEPVPMPEFGIYKTSARPAPATVWICFYRAWLQAGDLEVVDALFSALEEKGLRVHGLYSLSLRSPAVQAELLIQAQECPPNVVVMMQSFSICPNDDRADFSFRRTGLPRFAGARRTLLQGSLAGQPGRFVSGRGGDERRAAGD